jgi:hypothetical protein
MRTSPICPLLACLAFGCAPASPTAEVGAFGDGKADTGYQSSGDAREVEVDLEADLVTGGDADRAAIALGQFAMTWLRKTQQVYLQSLAEDDGGASRVEWKIGASWVSAAQAANLPASAHVHFRIRGLNAIVAGGATTKIGDAWQPILPIDPDAAGGAGCEDGLDPSDPHWYAWQPDRSGCAEPTQRASLRVSKLPPRGEISYPEYDRLLADGKLDVLVVFGQIGESLQLADDDYGLTEVDGFSSWLLANGFVAAETSLGRRFVRDGGSVAETVDVYGPREFGGLKDTGHYATFVSGFAEHEVIVYNGHSMLGQSAFFSQPGLYADPTKYQIVLYNGCLGYEYYVNPILIGKHGADNIDIVSNVVETWVGRHIPETAALLTNLFHGVEGGGRVSWQEILVRANQLVGNEGFYGASGIRGNRFHPVAE